MVKASVTAFPDPHDADVIGVEQRLSLAYASREKRSLLAALWELDARMRRIFASRREPAIAAIKLAWWQERLEVLGSDAVPAEPLLARLASIAQHGERAVPLGGFPAAWRELLDSEPWTPDSLEAYSACRSRALMVSAAAVLGGEARESLVMATKGWALVDVAAAAMPPIRRDVWEQARFSFDQAGRPAWPRSLRPVGMIVELARKDAARAGTALPGAPHRVARMAWHALTGR